MYPWCSFIVSFPASNVTSASEMPTLVKKTEHLTAYYLPHSLQSGSSRVFYKQQSTVNMTAMLTTCFCFLLRMYGVWDCCGFLRHILQEPLFVNSPSTGYEQEARDIYLVNSYMDEAAEDFRLLPSCDDVGLFWNNLIYSAPWKPIQPQIFYVSPGLPATNYGPYIINTVSVTAQGGVNFSIYFLILCIILVR